MIDIFIPLLVLTFCVIIGMKIGFNSTNRKIIIIAGWLLAVTSLFTFVALSSRWSAVANYNSQQFELVEKLPLEWSKSQQAYFFKHDSNWKSAEVFIDFFDERMVQKNSDYDSCMVYQVFRPQVWGLFSADWWGNKFEYRQSEDILLISREMKTIEVK